MLSGLQAVSMLRPSFCNATRKRQHTHRLLNLSFGRFPVAGFHFSPGPISPDRTPAPGDTGSVRLTYKDQQSQAMSESVGQALRAVVEYKASGPREQGSFDHSLETYFYAKSSPLPVPFRPAQKWLYDELTTPSTPQFRIRGEETYEEFTKRLPWPNTSSRLREAFYDDIASNILSNDRERQHAILKLYDATDQDLAPFLKYCGQLSEKDLEPTPSTRSLVIEVSDGCRNAEVVLRHMEKHDSANWLAEFANQEWLDPDEYPCRRF